ncbi:LamG domain-containing protein [Salinimicrobium oceani]|uniref:LamG domain-containing protein n=1 Tax=Salinimicrobium oceani TaxID=2722702 RepID=A0ABX1CV02_9FLAO|nr:LamG domain-containing protein [Salinimicrobium oceani]NJW52115.1 LamG domain-containing protein [Salinimicrobium oceani]
MRIFSPERKFLVLLYLLATSCGPTPQDVEIWSLDNTQEIGGNALEVVGNPEVAPGNDYLVFDGEQDGLLIDANPVAEMQAFTIEVDFMPGEGFPEQREQRFLHIQDPEDESRRILLELRLNDKQEWYGDWFIRSEDESLTLMDSTKTHPVNEWYTMSLVYRNGKVRGLVNGKEEVSGDFKYLPINGNAKTSVGTRMDRRSWFKGAIREIRFKPLANSE